MPMPPSNAAVAAAAAAAANAAARRARLRARTIDLQQQEEAIEEVERDGEGEAEGAAEGEEGVEDDGVTIEPVPEPSLSHLREISSLASWTVSTYKPGCGVLALLSPSTSQFWQSDGPQPHLLNIHFFKLVRIVKLRVYLDFSLDESYTPTRMMFLAGMGMYDLTEFAEWVGEEPKGWVDVPLEGVGGGEDGNVLRAMVVQIRVCENHQNGKDTHVRGVQVFAMDERGAKGVRRRGVPQQVMDGGEDRDREEDIVMRDEIAEGTVRRRRRRPRIPILPPPTTTTTPPPIIDEATRALLLVGLEEPDWMGEPELR